MAERPVIGVFGHFGNGNLGDEAIIAATIEQIRRRIEDVEIVCFSLRPDDTAFRHGVETFPIHPSGGWPVAARASEADDLPWKLHRARNAADLSPPAPSSGWRQRIKALPVAGFAAKAARDFARRLSALAAELEFALRAAAYVKRLDLLVIAGSNQFLDNFGGLWAFPYGLLRWTTLAKLTGSKVAFVSVGAGPLDRTSSKLFIRCAARLADYVSYRDSPSKAMVESGRPKVDGPVFPDLAFGLSRSGAGTARGPARQSVVVGINPMPVFDSRYWYEHDPDRYSAYVRTLSDLAARLVNGGRFVFFFPTMWRDDDVIHDVVRALESDHDLKLDRDFAYKPNDRVQTLVEVMQEADIVVATRFHASVLSYHLGLPVLGIGYYRKTAALMEQMDQGRYHVSLDACDADTLWHSFLELEANRASESARIAARTSECRRRIGEQWDTVLGLVGFEGPARAREGVAAEAGGR